MLVPRIIHQTWRDDALPDRLASFRAAWQRLHPEWAYRFWTDETARMFVGDHYPWFLETYDAYRSPIMRVDAARYLWMYHFGGVYADLDLEPLQPLDHLLNNSDGPQLSMAREPASHSLLYGKPLIVSNAFLASTPGHPAWQEVLDLLVERRAWPDPLAATGPFLLTDLYLRSSGFRAAVRLLDSYVMSPFDKFETWAASGPRRDELNGRVPRATIAIHHWLGSWWRDPGQIL